MNNTGSDSKPAKVKDMDLLKSLMKNGGEDQAAADEDESPVKSGSSYSLSTSSSSGDVSYESSVSENTKRQSACNIAHQETEKRDDTPTSEIDHDFFDMTESKPKASKDIPSDSPAPTTNGHVADGQTGAGPSPPSSKSGSRSGSVDSELNRRNSTSTFNFRLDIDDKQTGSEKTNAGHGDNTTQVHRSRRRKRRPQKTKAKLQTDLTSKSPRDGSSKLRSPRREDGSDERRYNDNFPISPWDYGESGHGSAEGIEPRGLKPAGASRGQKQAKSRAMHRRPVDQHRLEEDRQVMLERKYKELRELLTQGDSDNMELDRELLQQAKQILRRYKVIQSGNIPGSTVVAPPSGRPPAGRRRMRVHGQQTPADYSASETQTELGSSRTQVSPEGETVYIDLVHTEASGKHVTFAHGHNKHAANADVDYKKLARMELEYAMDGATRASSSSSSPRGRSNRPGSGRGRTVKKRRPPSATSSDGSPSPQRPQRQTRSPSNESQAASSNSSPSPGRHRHRSETSDSESTSRSRSREKSFNPSDHDLKNSKNPQILAWLRKKNKLIRKQKVQERKKERAKQKEEQRARKEEAERHMESEKRVRKWMHEKKAEARLLQKRERMETPPRLKFEGTVVIDETVLLQQGEVTGDKASLDVDGDIVNRQGDGHDKTCDKNTNKKDGTRTITVKVNMKGEETLKCTCGFVDTIKMREEEERQTRMSVSKATGGVRKISHPDYSIRRRPVSAKKSSVSPRRRSKKKESDGSKSDATEKQRMSYDEWVKLKRNEAIRKQRQENKKQKEQMSKSDPEVERVISEMAQKRIEQIKSSRKRIDTGISKIDEKANAYPEGARDSDEDAEEGSPGPVRHSWNLEDGVQPQRPNTAKPGISRPRRPASSRQRPASAPRGRPTSSRQFFRAPAPPTPSRSPAPGAVAEDGRVSIPTSPRRRAKSPKPADVIVTSAYKKVRHQQGSWDEFSDYVWDKVNEKEGGDMQDDERPEPMGCDESELENQTEHNSDDHKANAEEEDGVKKSDSDSNQGDAEDGTKDGTNTEDSASGSKEVDDIKTSEAEQQSQDAGAETGEENEVEQETEEEWGEAEEGDEEDDDEKDAEGDVEKDAEENAERDVEENAERDVDKGKEGVAEEGTIDDTDAEEAGQGEADEDKGNKQQGVGNDASSSDNAASAYQPPEIVIDGASTEDSAQDDESRQGASPSPVMADEPAVPPGEGDLNDHKEDTHDNDNHDTDSVHSDNVPDKHVPCILDITIENEAVEKANDKHVTFITNNDD